MISSSRLAFGRAKAGFPWLVGATPIIQGDACRGATMRSFDEAWELLLAVIQQEARESGTSARVLARQWCGLPGSHKLSDAIGKSAFLAPLVPGCKEYEDLWRWFQQKWNEGSHQSIVQGLKYSVSQQSRAQKKRSKAGDNATPIQSQINKLAADRTHSAKELFRVLYSWLDEEGANPCDIEANNGGWSIEYSDHQGHRKTMSLKTFKNQLSKARRPTENPK